MFSFFFRKSCGLWDNVENMVQPDRPQIKTRHMRIVCWIPKAKNAHSEYLIIVTFPLEQRLQERAWILGYMHIARLVHIVSSKGTLR